GSRAHPYPYEQIQLGRAPSFPPAVYTLLGCRRDALFELLDTILVAPSLETPAHRSLVPSCQRGWASRHDALIAGSIELDQLEALVAAFPLVTAPAWYAVDASVCPAAMPRPAPSEATIRIPTGSRLASRSSPAGTAPGWSRYPAAAPAGPR